ncbi:hypothetical protein LXL04_038869 [Taraxacum kok-saghyz]
MRAAVCFPHFQLPKCQFHTLSGSWREKIHNISTKRSTIYNLQGGNGNTNSRRWTRKSLSTNTEGIGKNILSRQNNNIGQQITDVTTFTHTNLNTSRVEINEFKSIHLEEKISENKDESKLVTVIVFDIETTGFSRENERIIEIALQDLSGGVESTFESLVNPDKFVPNEHIHGISNYMVKQPGVPRMKDLIPILIDYVKSRQKPGGKLLLIAHNGKSFDVPFLINEFSRYSCEIPSDWEFADSMSLAREIMKVQGSKLSSKSLQALKEYYGIQITGKAHRAMADVNVLALVLQRMTCDLKLTVPGLLENYAFRASELSNNSKKKKSSR